MRRRTDIHSDSIVVKKTLQRKKVGDTDIGTELKEQIHDLEELLYAYRSGRLTEKI